MRSLPLTSCTCVPFVNDRIGITVELADEYARVADLLRSKEAFIAREVRAKEISIGDVSAGGRSCEGLEWRDIAAT